MGICAKEKSPAGMKPNTSMFPLDTKSTNQSAMTSQSPDPVEDYPQGYPRFSALIGASDQFHICRRFSNLRSRLLLAKQDKLSLLESQLERVDREEEAVLFLGSNRIDMNLERLSLLSRIDDALADYGARYASLSYLIQPG